MRYRTQPDLECATALHDRAVAALHAAGPRLIGHLKPPPGTYALFTHQAEVLARTDDVWCLIKRLYHNREKLATLDVEPESLWAKFPEYSRGPLDAQAFESARDETAKAIKVDFEALYLFGSILLDQWSVFAAYLRGLPSPSPSTFHRIVSTVEQNQSAGPLRALWPLRSVMRWLTFQIRYYRNVFIVHVDRPIQQGFTRSTHCDEFQLFRPVLANAGGNVVQRIARLQGCSEAEVERPGLMLQEMFAAVGEREDARERDEIAQLVRACGMSTPSFQQLCVKLLSFLADASPVLIEAAIAEPERVNLGAAQC